MHLTVLLDELPLGLDIPYVVKLGAFETLIRRVA